MDDIEKAFDEGKLDLAVFPSGYLIDEKTRQHRLLMTMVSREAPDPDAGTGSMQQEDQHDQRHQGNDNSFNPASGFQQLSYYEYQ